MVNSRETLPDPADFELRNFFDLNEQWISPESMNLDELPGIPSNEHRGITPTMDFRSSGFHSQWAGHDGSLYNVDQSSPYRFGNVPNPAMGNLHQLPNGVTYDAQHAPLTYASSAGMALCGPPPQSASPWPFQDDLFDEPKGTATTTSFHRTESTVRSQQASSCETEFGSPNQVRNTIPKPSFAPGYDMQGYSTGALPSSAISIHSSYPAMSHAPGSSVLVHRSRDSGTSARIGDTVNCEMCDKKRVRMTSLYMAPLCTRCHERDAILNARPAKWEFNPNITRKMARDSVVVWQPPLMPGLEDVNDFSHSGPEWVKRFIDAVCVPYEGVLEENATEEQIDLHENYTAQQSLLNKKPHYAASKKKFTPENVNIRMWLLYDTVHIYHFGGVFAFPGGPDEHGYGQDKTLRFEERLEAIVEVLKLNKKVAIDVIGNISLNIMMGLVANPDKYADRKTQNSKSNRTKKGHIVVGKIHSAPARRGNPARRSNKGKLPAKAVVAGPSQKRKRPTPRSPR